MTLVSVSVFPVPRSKGKPDNGKRSCTKREQARRTTASLFGAVCGCMAEVFVAYSSAKIHIADEP